LHICLHTYYGCFLPAAPDSSARCSRLKKIIFHSSASVFTAIIPTNHAIFNEQCRYKSQTAQTLSSSLPNITPATQKAKLKNAYMNPIAGLPPSIKVSTSKEKVENVVNPPHTPTVKKSPKFELKSVLLPIMPDIKPIAKAPITLIRSVDTGSEILFAGIARPTK